METITLSVQGMTCGGCAKSVTRVLSDIQGVAKVDVDWQHGRAVVQVDTTQTAVQALVDAVEDAGFDAEVLA